MIKYEEVRAAKSGQTKNLVIMLHGVGSNSSDLISLADYLNLNQDTTFLSPNAPYEYDMAPTGFQWFSLRDRSTQSMYRALASEGQVFNNYIDKKLSEYDLSPADLIVLGFSQGAMLALHHLPRRNEPINSIIAVSGALIKPDVLAEEIKSKPDVLLIHGNQDPVVPFIAFEEAHQKLKSLGINCDTLIMHDTGHYINPKALQKIQDYLKHRNFI